MSDLTLLLFDIDGTLLRAPGAGRAAYVRAFNDIYGSSFDFEDVSFIGQTDYEAFQDAARHFIGRELNEHEYAAIIERFQEIFGEEFARCERFYLMPGVVELLEHLAARQDVLLGLATGNLETTGRLKLKRGNIEHYFPFGGFGSDAPDRPGMVRAALAKARRIAEVNLERTFIIDDSPHGVMAARASGIATIAVGTGLSDHGSVLDAAPAHYLEDLSDIGAFLRCAGLV